VLPDSIRVSYFDLWKLCAKVLKKIRYDREPCGALEPKNEFARLATCGALGSLLRMGELTKTLLSLNENDLSGFSQTEMTTLAMKEFDPQLALELLNVLSKCRLSDVKPLRHSSDVQRPDYFDEVP
jgi:hypothetical protein